MEKPDISGGDETSATNESHEMTLDEWKAQQDTRRAKTDFNIRKPGEGDSGDPSWTRTYVLTKPKEPEKAEGDEELEQDQVLLTTGI